MRLLFVSVCLFGLGCRGIPPAHGPCDGSGYADPGCHPGGKCGHGLNCPKAGGGYGGAREVMFVKKTVCVPFVEADTNGPCTVAMVGPEGVYGPAAPCPAAPAGRCDAAVAAALQDVADRLNRIENRMAVIESRGGAAAAPDGCAAPVGPVCRPPVSDRKCFLKSLCPTPANKDGCR